ncbi:MAG: hypothetical protein AAF515_01295 [Pseudomonadota bacterium]
MTSAAHNSPRRQVTALLAATLAVIALLGSGATHAAPAADRASVRIELIIPPRVDIQRSATNDSVNLCVPAGARATAQHGSMRTNGNGDCRRDATALTLRVEGSQDIVMISQQ